MFEGSIPLIGMPPVDTVPQKELKPAINFSPLPDRLQKQTLTPLPEYVIDPPTQVAEYPESGQNMAPNTESDIISKLKSDMLKITQEKNASIGDELTNDKADSNMVDLPSKKISIFQKIKNLISRLGNWLTEGIKNFFSKKSK